MRVLRLLPCLLALSLLAAPNPALAHKVNVFAYVDGNRIVLDCFFNKTNKVHNGAISVLDATTGEVLARAATDAQGALSLPVPPKAIASGHDLKIVLKAGEGHQSDTLIQASEFAGLKAANPPTFVAQAEAKAKPEAQAKLEAKAKLGAAGTQPKAAAPTTFQAAPPTLDEAALTRIVEQAVDNRMAPVKRMLMQTAERGPSPTEIVGGIGYIVGLFGIMAFVASRRKDRSHK